MKTLKYILPILSLIIFLFSGCEKSEFEAMRSDVKEFFEREKDSTLAHTIVRGTLWNKQSNSPISNVEVSLFTANAEYKATSDAEGKFSFDVAVGEVDYAMLGIRNSGYLHDTLLSQIGKTNPSLNDPYRDKIQMSYKKQWSHDLNYGNEFSRRFMFYQCYLPPINDAIMFAGKAYSKGNLGIVLDEEKITLLPSPVKGVINDMRFSMRPKGKLKINFQLDPAIPFLNRLITVDAVATRPFATPYFYNQFSFGSSRISTYTVEIDDIPANEDFKISYSIRAGSPTIIKGGTFNINFSSSGERIETVVVQ